MTDAETAYAAAEEQIATAKQQGSAELDLNIKACRALETLPPQIAT